MFEGQINRNSKISCFIAIVSQLLEASRLEWSLIFSVAAFLIGMIFRMPRDEIILGGVTIFLITMAHFSLNNYYDIKTDQLNIRKLSMRNPFIRGKSVKKRHLNLWIGFLLIISWSLMFLMFIMDSIIKILVLTIISLVPLVISLLYSMPPLRFKGRPLLDLFSTSFVFGFMLPLSIGLIGSDIEIKGILPDIKLPVPLHVLIVIILLALFLINGIHFLTIFVDMEYDEVAGDKTTAVWLGKEKSANLTALLALISTAGTGLSMILLTNWEYLRFGPICYLLGAVELLFAFKLWIKKSRESAMSLCKVIIIVNSIGILDFIISSFL